MIFNGIDDIVKVIKDNPAKDLLVEQRAVSDMLTKYVTGKGLVESLEKLPFFMNDELDAIRKKLSRSTRDLFTRILQPLDKVFTAEGGFRMYGLSQTQEQQFDVILSNIRNGMSMKDWTANVALYAFLLDPNSVLLTELDAKGNAYPTYKSTNDIYDYAFTGRKPEYIIFKLGKEDIKMLVGKGRFAQPNSTDNVYRVMDDAYTYYVNQGNATDSGNQHSIISQIRNPFGKVPGIIASNIPVFNANYFESPLMPVMEIAADYFNDNSSKSLFKKYQMHPKEFGPRIDCKVCSGIGKINGEDCTKCGGTGNQNSIKVSERLSYSIDENGEAKIPIPPGGFYGPPIESWNMMTQELDMLAGQSNDTFWEQNKMRKATGPDVQDGTITTATGEVINERTKIPKLRKFSKWAESTEKVQIDNIKFIKFGVKKESTIVYGDRYIQGTPEELMDIYEVLRTKGAPIPALDRALRDVYEAKFATNPMELRYNDILMRIEPFVHYSVPVVLAWEISPEIKDQKVYFGEWLATKTKDQIVIAGEDKMRADLAAFAKQRAYVEPIKVSETIIDKAA